MKRLLSLRENVKAFYELYDRYVDGFVRFAFSLCVYLTVIYNTGYSRIVSSPAAALIMAVASAFLPKAFISVFMSLLIVVELTGVSTEVTIIAAVLLLVMLLSYFVFKVGDSWLMAFALMMCLCNLSPVLLALGLLIEPTSLIVIVFGILLYGLMIVVKKDFSVLSSASGNLSMGRRINLLLTDLVTNERFLLILAAIVISILVIILIRKLRINYAPVYAAAAGGMVFLTAFLMGNFFMNVTVYYVFLLIGFIVDAGASLFVIHFVVDMDYKRTEFLTFEDEEYVYYVKAVPKRTVSATQKKIANVTEEGGKE